MQNEFEKKAQDQMAGFSINPSEEVWLHVEKNIRQQKRKKRLIMFWWSAAIIFIAGGGLTWFVMNRDEVRPTAFNKIMVENNRNLPIQKHSTSEKAKEIPATTQQNIGATIRAKNALNSNNKLPVKEQQILIEKGSGTQNFKVNQQSNLSQIKRPDISSNSTVSSNNKSEGNEKFERENIAGRQPAKPLKTGSPSLKGKPVDVSQNESQTINKDVAKEQTIVNRKNRVAEIPNPLKEVVPSTQNIQTLPADTSIIRSADTIAATLLTHENLDAKNDSITVVSVSKKKDRTKITGSKWKVGFYASAGIADNVSKVPLGNNKMLNDAAYTTPANSTGNSAAVPVVQLEYSKGFAGYLGAFASRPLSQKFGILAGLNFQYYSTKTNTGSKVNTQRIVYDTLTGSSSLVKEYFVPIDRTQANFSQATSTFTNRYYFLQMPMELTWLFNKSKPQGLMFSVGVTPGILLGSTALYYNRLDRIAYVDKQQFKKFQLSAQAGFSIGIINSKKYWLQAGPQVMAGQTNLSKPVYNSNQHLLYMGIGTKVTFK